MCPNSVPTPVITPVDGELRLNLFFVTDSDILIDVDVVIQYDEQISKEFFKASLVVTKEPKLITDSKKLPSQAGFIYWPITVIVAKGEEIIYRERLGPLRIVVDDKYFEYLVHTKLEALGFSSEWLGGVDLGNPGIKAYFKLYPTEIFDIQCTTQKIYDSSKLSMDYGMFIKNRTDYEFTRLLVVTQHSEITKDAIEKVHTFSEPVSMIRYADLLQLTEQRRSGLTSKQDVYITLTKRGEIKTTPLLTIESAIKKQGTLECFFRF